MNVRIKLSDSTVKSEQDIKYSSIKDGQTRKWMNDILKEEGHYYVMTLEELEARHNISLTEYYGLIRAIPKQWKSIQSNKNLDNEDTEDYKVIDMIDNSQHPCQLMYKLFMKQRFIPPKLKALKWADELTVEISLNDFLIGLEKGRVHTINSCLRSYITTSTCGMCHLKADYTTWV